MREIIHIGVGQCGIQLANNFFNTICKEHDALPNGSYTQDVYFSDADKRSIPNSIFIDLDKDSIDALLNSKDKIQYDPGYFINGEYGAGNNWAKGFYTEGAEILDFAMDVIRHKMEMSDHPQGFQLTHSLSGGTGSGFGTLLVNNLREQYPDKMISTFSILPTYDEVVVSPYNCVLGMHLLIEHADQVFLMDNKAMTDILSRHHKITEPKYSDINKIVTSVMTGVTAPFRFSGKINSSWRKLATNLIPFPRMHFFNSSSAPYTEDFFSRGENISSQLCSELFDYKNGLLSSNRMRKYMTAATLFRGEISQAQVENSMRLFSQTNSLDWIPENISVSYCDVPPTDFKLSATMVGNSAVVEDTFQRMAERFSAMFRRKAFTMWYTGEGMDEMEFTEAESNLNDLLSEYQCIEHSCCCSVDEEEEEGET